MVITVQKITSTNSFKRNRVIFFSGGKSSFTVAHLVKELYPNDNILLYFTDTRWEDEDLYRFIYEASDKLQLPMLYHSLGLNPIQLMHKQAVVFNSRIGNCSTILKMGVAADYFYKNIEPPMVKWHNQEFLKQPIAPNEEGFKENTTVYFGIGWEEAHREAAIKKNWERYGFAVEMPMMEEVIDNNEVLSMYDIKQPRLYDMQFSHNNCFHGKERFITNEGLKTFAETVGQKVKVIGERAHWQDATIQRFGKQPIVELVITKSGKERIIETTAGHRWFVRKDRKRNVEKLTSELIPGNRLWSLYQTIEATIKPSAIGIAQGIVFGDGTYARDSWNNPATVTLCGEKVELLKYFPLQDVKEVKNVGLKVCDLPKSWKHYPDLNESKSFLLGWLMGYIATDGSVSKGSITLYSSNIADLQFIQTLCIKVNIAFNEIGSYKRVGIDGKESEMHIITFVKSTFKKDWLIRQKHIEEFGESTKIRPGEWMVKEVRHTDRVEDVYCAVVPKGERFVLEGNILTGNCKGRCVKAGQGHFINLLQQMPQLFQETMAFEHHMSNYVSTHHYYRSQKYYPECEQFDDDTLEILLADLNDAYEDYFWDRVPKPKPFVHPSFTAVPFEIDKLLIEQSFIKVPKKEFLNDDGKLDEQLVIENQMSLFPESIFRWQRIKIKKFVKSTRYKLVETRHLQRKTYAYMKKQKDGQTKAYPLRNLYWDAAKEGLHVKQSNVIVQHQKSEALDLFDVGGCGCDFSQTDASACDLMAMLK